MNGQENDDLDSARGVLSGLGWVTCLAIAVGLLIWSVWVIVTGDAS